MSVAKTKPGWKRVFGWAGITYVIGTTARWCFPDLISKSDVFALTTTVLILKMLIDLPGAVRSYGRARKGGASVAASVRTLIPAELIGMFHLERKTQRAFLAWLRREPPVKNLADGKTYNYYESSQYPTIFIIVLIACATEIPISYFAMDVLIPDPVVVQYVHWIMIGTLLYTLILMFGDRYLLKHSPHVLGVQSMHLSAGARFSAEIPLDAVEAVLPVNNAKELSEARSAWLRRSGFDPVESVIGTPVDVPNVAVVLKKSASAKILKYQTEQQGVRNVLIYVDHPTSFVQAVRERLASQTAE